MTPAVLGPPAERGLAYWEALLERLQALLVNTAPEAKEVFERAYRELIHVPIEAANEAVAQCLMATAQFMYLQADPRRADEAATAAVSLARQLGNPSALRRALSIQGATSQEINAETALAHLAEALQIAREIGDERGQSAIWNNLGTALLSVGQFNDAVRCYQIAAELGSETESEFMAIANIAGVCFHDGNSTLGREAARKAIALNPNPATAAAMLARVLAEAHFARLLVNVDELDAAAEHVVSAKAWADRLGAPRAHFAVAVADGLVDIHTNQAAAGLAKLNQALAFARTSAPSEVGDVLRSCIAGYEAAGQPDTALVYVHELLALNREAKAVQLLARFRKLVAAGSAGADLQGRTAVDARTAAKAIDLHGEVARCLEDLVNAAMTAAERAGHHRLRIFRVSRLCELFALSEGWAVERAQALAFAARLCDLGMIVIPDELLRKTRGLSSAERKVVGEHTQFGAEVLTKARLAILQPCVPVAKFHHEQWNGAGPWGLQGEGIPIEARMTALADAFDSLTHHRPWREAMSLPAALRTIRAEAGTRFDPSIAERFVGFVKGLYWEHDDFDEFLAEHAHENAYVRARAQIDRLINVGI